MDTQPPSSENSTPAPVPALQSDEKKCPFCAETIKREAVICRFCGREQPMTGEAAKPRANPAPTKLDVPSPRAAKFLLFGLPVLCVGLALVVAASGVFGDSSRTSPTQGSSSRSSATTGHRVEYEVETDANGISVTYQNAQGDTTQERVPLGTRGNWSHTQIMNAGAFVYISAQMATRGGNTITCRVRVDGTIARENTSRGEFTIATCSGRL